MEAMKTVEDIRHGNLRRLAEESGGITALNTRLGRSARDSTFNQILNRSANSKGGKPKAMGTRMARGIEEALSLSEGWMDTDHDDASFQSLQVGPADQSVFAQLDVQAICGNGRPAPDHPEVVSMMTMPVGMAQSLLGTTNRLGLVKIVSAANDSMTPTIEPDDLLFVDTSVVEYVSEGVYLLVHDRGLICKRLSRPGKDIIVSSDNPYYKSWKWSERPEQTRIVGRVLRALPIQFKKFSGD